MGQEKAKQKAQSQFWSFKERRTKTSTQSITNQPEDKTRTKRLNDFWTLGVSPSTAKQTSHAYPTT